MVININNSTLFYVCKFCIQILKIDSTIPFKINYLKIMLLLILLVIIG